MTTQEILQAAQTARMPLALADADTKNAVLEAMAVALRSWTPTRKIWQRLAAESAM